MHMRCPTAPDRDEALNDPPILSLSADPHVHLVDLHELFLGHGIHCATCSIHTIIEKTRTTGTMTISRILMTAGTTRSVGVLD